jgi:hypothetical protein
MLKANQRFGGTCRFYLQGRRISQARDQHEADSKKNKNYIIAHLVKKYAAINGIRK